MYDWGSVDPFQGLLHEDPRDHIKELEELASSSKQNEVSVDHIICTIFPYSIFLNKFLYEAAETRERKFDDMVDQMIKGWEKELMARFSQMLGVDYTEPIENLKP